MKPKLKTLLPLTTITDAAGPLDVRGTAGGQAGEAGAWFQGGHQ